MKLPLAVLLVAAAASQAGAGPAVQSWRTNATFTQLLAPQDPLEFAPDDGATAVTLTVNPDSRYQVMEGFGVSMTDSSAHLLTRQLSEAKRAEVMRSLFGAEGIGISLLRQPMGSCDFNREMYSYAETAGDTALAHFSVAKDEEVMIPRIQEAMTINPGLRIMASPWSPPGWMKTTGSMIGGYLKTEYYPAMASYFVRYVQAYREHGIPVFAVTPQNEPGYASNRYPGCLYSGSAQMTFIRDHLAPAFSSAGLDVKILCFDHNYDGWSIPASIMADTGALAVTAGTAFHHYGGDPSYMTSMHLAHPEKEIWFTEGGIGDWNNTFDNIAHEVIAIPRNWAKSVIFWNAALDPDDLPALIGANNTNEGMVTIRSDVKDSVTYNPQYYYLGHLSKFVKPGAVRIDSPNWNGTVETVAFQNTDGSCVLVAFNKQVTAASVKLLWKGQSAKTVLPAKSLTTFVWTELPAIKTNPLAHTAQEGTSTSLRVEAASPAGVTYQWYKNGVALEGATEPILPFFE